MDLNILTKNTTVAISNIPTDINIEEFCNKLREFLSLYGKVSRIVYMVATNKDDSYVVVKFKEENSVINVRNSLSSEVFYGIHLNINEEKTIQQIKPKCKYIKIKEENDSSVVEITNIPKVLNEDDIKEIFEEHGEILFLETMPTKYDTTTAYAYYKDSRTAKNIKKLMNGGTIENHKIEIELCSPISSCLCISNIIDFNMINIQPLIDKIKKFGVIKELEVYGKEKCLYVNFEEISSAIKLEDEISHSTSGDFKDLKVELCVPIANNYKISHINDEMYSTFNISKRENETNDHYQSVKKIKPNEEDTNTKLEIFESRPRKGHIKAQRYTASQSFWNNSSTSESSNDVKNDIKSSSPKNKDSKEDDIKKNDSEQKESENKGKEKEDEKKIDPIKNEPDKPKVLNEPKPTNRIRMVLKKRVLQYKNEICYKGTSINMVVHHMEGDKDKTNKIFSNNKTIVFEKKLQRKNNEALIEQITDRLGRTDDSWAFCLGCVDDDGDYTEKMKSDFNNFKVLNDIFIKKGNLLMYEDNGTFVVLLPSDYNYSDLLEQVFIKETREERTIMDALGRSHSPFFIFVIFVPKTDSN